MSKENNLTDFLTNIADNIRFAYTTKCVPEIKKINPQDFASYIIHEITDVCGILYFSQYNCIRFARIPIESDEGPAESQYSSIPEGSYLGGITIITASSPDEYVFTSTGVEFKNYILTSYSIKIRMNGQYGTCNVYGHTSDGSVVDVTTNVESVPNGYRFSDYAFNNLFPKYLYNRPAMIGSVYTNGNKVVT